MDQLSIKIEDGVLTIFVSGRVDTTNASQVQEEIKKYCEENAHEELVLDVEEMLYISSAGLRVILSLKKTEKSFKIINASPEVYEIFDMTGFSEMMDISKAYRKFSVDGCKIIGQGAKGIVYRYSPDTIVKVYKSNDDLPAIHKERELARKAFVLGIPTAISYDIVRVGDGYGSVFELLDAKSLSECIADDPANTAAYVDMFAEMLKTIHGTIADDVLPSVKKTAYKWLDGAAPYLPEDQVAGIRELIDAVPDCDNMIHGDYHTNNVMLQNGEPILIDMDTLARGNAIFELANVHATYVGFGIKDPHNVENFLGIPFETSDKVWKQFLPKYLGADDPEVISRVELAASLLSHLRVIRHTVKRRSDETELVKAVTQDSAARIAQLLPQVKSLALEDLLK